MNGALANPNPHTNWCGGHRRPRRLARPGSRLLIHWRNKYGHDPKLRELRYRLTLSKAKDPDKLAFAKQMLEETLRLRPEDEEDVLKDTLDTLLGVDIIRVVKDRGDKPVYCMHTEQGAITLRTIGHVTSRKRCTDRIAEVTGVVVPVVSPEVWDGTPRPSCASARAWAPETPSTPREETRSWLDDYLIKATPREGGVGEGRPARGPLPEGGAGPHLPQALPQVAA